MSSVTKQVKKYRNRLKIRDSVIKYVSADSPDHVCITLKNDINQELTLVDMEKEHPKILWKDSGAQKEQEGENI